MNGVQLLGLIVATALVSSLATLALGWLLFERWLRPQLERRWAALAELLEARVKAGAGAAGQELLEPLRAQVRGGVEDAAAGLLPQFKAELTAGFREAATDSLPALRDDGTASICGNNRVVFNIGGNKYRLVVKMQYRAGIAWVKFIGTHTHTVRPNQCGDRA